MLLLLLLPLSFGLFARFCVLHIHTTDSILAFVFLSFCFLISFVVDVVVVSFILRSFVAVCNLLVAFTYRALLFLFKLLENLPEYKCSFSTTHPSVKRAGCFYHSILQHPNRARTNRTTLKLWVYSRSVWVYVLPRFEFFCAAFAASFRGSCDVFAVVVLFLHSFSIYFGAVRLAAAVACECRYLCCYSTSYAFMLQQPICIAETNHPPTTERVNAA